MPQALVYVPNAAAHAGEDPSANLLPLSALKESKTYQLRPKDETQKTRASVTVISLGLIDQVQIAASGLVPGQEYTLSRVDTVSEPHVHKPLTKMKASPVGIVIANTLGPVRVSSSEKVGSMPVTFVLEPVDEKTAVSLVQQ